MPSSENTLVLVTLEPDSRSASPMTPSPSREVKGLTLFRAISRRLVRRSNEYLEEGDCNSSGSDSCSSTSMGRLSRRLRKDTNSGSSSSSGDGSQDSGFRSISPNQMSSSSSDSGSDIQQRRHHHSTSAESIRKVFQNLNLNVRSQSCTNTKEKRKTKKPAPKRILRQPTTYTYVKGLSGLPTQRVLNTSRMFQTCGCSMQYTPGR